MKTLILAAAAASALTFGGIGAASAMSATQIPLAGASAPEITLVAGGCGPGFHRGPYGGCRPNFGRPYGRPFRRPYGYGRPGFYR